MKNLYIKYSIRIVTYILILVYFFFINTQFNKANILPFLLLLFIPMIGAYFLFQYDKKKTDKFFK